MEFIVDNLVWFIVGGVVILMTIVGYLAEKTDFACKKYREKVGQEKEKINIEKEHEKDEAPKEVPVQDVGVIDIVSSNKELEDPVKEEDSYASLNNNQVNEVKDIDEDLYAPLNQSDKQENDLNVEPQEDLYAPLNSNQESEVKDVEADLYTPLVQNNNIPQNIEEVQDISPENIINYETETNDNMVNDVLDDDNEILDQSPVIESSDMVFKPETDSPIESLNEESETLEMPIQEDIDTLPIVENSDYDKIFPDDPVIINESKGSEETSIEEKEIDDSNAEDIWKF